MLLPARAAPGGQGIHAGHVHQALPLVLEHPGDGIPGELVAGRPVVVQDLLVGLLLLGERLGASGAELVASRFGPRPVLREASLRRPAYAVQLRVYGLVLVRDAFLGFQEALPRLVRVFLPRRPVCRDDLHVRGKLARPPLVDPRGGFLGLPYEILRWRGRPYRRSRVSQRPGGRSEVPSELV